MPTGCLSCSLVENEMTEEQLGYMTFSDWKMLDGERRDYYLWRAIIGRCKDCESAFSAKYEPKRSIAWKAGFVTLIVFSSGAGGFLAVVLGLANILKQ